MRTKALSRKIEIDHRRRYTIDETAKITGIPVQELADRIKGYKGVSRFPQTGQFSVSGETISHILTGIGIRWKRLPLEKEV